MLSNLRTLVLSSLVVGSFVLGACAGEEEEDPDFAGANVQACNDYIDTLTGLDCWDPVFDPMVDCEATYGSVTTCDISEYFDCIGATYSCENGTLAIDAAAAQECANLAACE